MIPGKKSKNHTVAEGASLKVFFRQMKSRSKISNSGRGPASVGIPTKVAGRRAARARCGMRPKAASLMEAGSRLEFAVSLPDFICRKTSLRAKNLLQSYHRCVPVPALEKYIVVGRMGYFLSIMHVSFSDVRS